MPQPIKVTCNTPSEKACASVAADENLQSFYELKAFSPECDHEEVSEWVRQKIKCLQNKRCYRGISKYIQVDWMQIRKALYFAYIAHYGQKRKLDQGQLYVEHPVESLIHYIEMLREEYDQHPLSADSRIDLTDNFIKEILHDVFEDFISKERIEERRRFFPLLARYVQNRFGSSVADFLNLVATKFSKKPETIFPSDLSRTDIERLNHFAQMAGIVATRDAANLTLRVSERKHNLRDADHLDNADQKALESANMVLALYAALMRTPAKELFDDFFRYFFRATPETLERFEKFIKRKQRGDRAFFEERILPGLEENIRNIIGHNHFEVQLSPLSLWRINMEIGENPFFGAQLGLFSDDQIPLVNDKILKSRALRQMLKKKLLYRIVVITESEEDSQAIWREGVTIFSQFEAVEYTRNSEQDDLLKLSGYRARRASVHWESDDEREIRRLEFKVIDRQSHYTNEFGKRVVAKNARGETELHYSVEPLERYLEHFQSLGYQRQQLSGQYRELLKKLLNPMGADLTEHAEDARVLIALIAEERVEPFINTMGQQQLSQTMREMFWMQEI